MILKISVGHEIRTIEHVRSVFVMRDDNSPDDTGLVVETTRYEHEGLALKIRETHDG